MTRIQLVLWMQLSALLAWTSLTAAAAAAEPVSYIAAAVQWNPVGNVSMAARDFIALNIDAWEPWVVEAAAAGAEVVVFPEGALGMFAAEDEGNTRDVLLPYCVSIGAVGVANPCTEAGNSPPPPRTSEFYQTWRASCLARAHSVYLAMNLCEVQSCSNSTESDQQPCPSDSHFLWNAELVFDPTGTLVMRYHKAHLFGGDAVFNEALPIPTAFNATFKSAPDTPVEFGSFVCFDIEFPHPALDVVAPRSSGGLGARNVLFSSWWVNAPPSFGALMLQQSWSRQQRVNLVAANIGAGVGSAGGGIFARGEPLAVSFNASDFHGSTRMVVAKLSSDVSVPPSVTEQSQKQLREDDALTNAASIPVVTVSPSSLPFSPCLPNGVTPALANCTLFTSVSLRSLAIQAGVEWGKEKEVRFELPAISADKGGLMCRISVTLLTASVPSQQGSIGSDAAAAEEAWAAVVFDQIQVFPFSPDPLHLQVCALQHCRTNEGEGDEEDATGVAPSSSSQSPILRCVESFDAYATRVSAFDLHMTGVAPSAQVAPMLGLDDGQVGSTALAEFTDSKEQQQQQKQKHRHHRLRHSKQSAMRQVSWSSTSSFRNESLFSTLLFGIVPDPAIPATQSAD